MNPNERLQEARRRHLSGDPATARAMYEEILASHPDHAPTLHALGVWLLQAGQPGEAAQTMERALALEPANAGLLLNLGTARHALGQTQAAETSFRRALEAAPGFIQADYNLGLLLLSTRRPAEARAHLEATARGLPQDPDVLCSLAQAMQATGDAGKARSLLAQALELAPGHARVLSNLGDLLREAGETDLAVDLLTRAVEADPGMPEAANNLGEALRVQGRLGEAVQALERALELAPGLPQALSNLGGALKDAGKVPEALTAFARAVEADPGFAAAHSNLLFTMNYVDLPQEEILGQHLEFARFHAPGRPESPARHPAPRGDPGKPRLKVGYVSADLLTHPVAFFLAPLLAAHDPERVEVFCYAQNTRADETTRRLQSLAHHWRWVGGLDDADLVRLMEADGLDAVVDLSGHTRGNRLTALARKPAPLVVTWLGYPNTTGLSAVNARFTDTVCDPPGAADSQHVEKLVRLAPGFMCYGPPADAPDPGPGPVGRGRRPAFGCFNNWTKVSDPCLDLWAAVLDAVPEAVLRLKSRALDDAYARAHCLERMLARGLDIQRVEFLEHAPTHADHMAAYARVDAALDTHPYNGTTTTCEALWMGVPVVSLAGSRHASRVGASILSRVGLADLVAREHSEYADIAAGLIRDPDRLHTLRASLRETMSASPLMDAPAFARSVESSLASLLAGIRDDRREA